MRFVCISDTHEQQGSFDIPDGDVLIHAGDLTWEGQPDRIKRAIDWLRKLPHKFKVVIGGNHDFDFYKYCGTSSIDFNILNNGGVSINGFNIWGSPVTPTFGGWAFMKDRGDEISEVWKQIPDNTDILITHGPPLGVLDLTPPRYGSINAGCYDLKKAVNRIKPKLHVFGHIHNGYGQLEMDGTIFVNASICDEQYHPFNKPILVDLETK